MSEETKGKQTKEDRGTDTLMAIVVALVIILVIVGVGIYFFGQKNFNDIKNKEKVTESSENKEDNSDKEDLDNDDSSKESKDYIINLEQDKELDFDIDGDDKEEKLKVEIESETVQDGEFSYVKSKYKLLIGGKEVLSLDGDDEYIVYTFSLMDFDNSDGKYQIGAYTNGGTDDSDTDIYDWDGKTLKSIGEFFYCFDEKDLNYDNTAGKTKYYSRVDAFKTSSLEKYTQYDKTTCKFTEIEPKDGIYTYYHEIDANDKPVYEYNATLKKDLKVYEKCEDNASTSTIKAQKVEATSIKFIYDGKFDEYTGQKTYSGYWVNILAKDGTKGWMKVDGSIGNDEMINGEKWENYFDMMYCD